MTRPREPRQRARASRVRSGCDTCKKRHVKCDETRPAPCNRCSKLQMKCEYPGQKQQQRRHVQPQLQPQCADTVRTTDVMIPAPYDPSRPHSSHGHRWPSLRAGPALMALSPREAMYFDAYRARVASKFPYPQFWYRSVLREATTDDVLQSCVIGLGALSLSLDEEGQQRRDCVASNIQPRHLTGGASRREAIKYYARALSLFRNRMGASCPCPTLTSSSHASSTIATSTTTTAAAAASAKTPPTPPSSRTMLMTTGLFAAYELLQGNINTADALLTSSLRILCTHLHIFRPDFSPIASASASVSASSSPSTTQTSSSSSPPLPTTSLAMPLDDEGIEEAQYLLPRMMGMNCLGAPFARGSDLEGLAFAMAVVSRGVPAPSVESSVAEVRRVWDVVMTRCGLWLFRTARKGLWLGEVGFREVVRGMHDVLLGKLGDWEALLGAKMGMLRGEGEVVERTELRVVLFGVRVSAVFGVCFLDASQMAWDGYVAEMGEALEIAEGVVGAGPEEVQEEEGEEKEVVEWRTQRMANPLYDNNLLIMVLVVAQHCRDRAVRSRALALSRRLSGEQATWDVKLHHLGVEVLFDLEEGMRGAVVDGVIASEHRYRWTGLEWEEDRVHVVVGFVGTVRGEDGQLLTREVRVRPEDYGFT